MSETLTTDAPTDAPVDERTMLMQRARMMNLTFSPNIGLETLRARIKDKMEGTTSNEAALAPAPTPAAGDAAPAVLSGGERPVNPLAGEFPTVVKARKLTLRQHMRNTQMRLVRLRITCLDPKKKDLRGEIFTVANAHLGTVRKFVPFGEVTDNGFHVPYCIYRMLQRRKFLNIRTTRVRGNQIHVEQGYAKEFALEVLPPLTPAQLTRLAVTQAAANGQTSADADI